MKLVINTAHQRFGGAIQVALSFIYECRKFPAHEYHIWVGPGIRKSLKEEDFPDNFHFEYFDFGSISLRTTFQINQTLQVTEKSIQPDVVISTSGPTYFQSKAPQIIGYNLGLYIYPESPYMKNRLPSQKMKNWLKKMVHFYFFRRDAAAYVVQTDDVNQRVRNALNSEKVYTVTNTHNHFYHNWKTFPPKLAAKRKNVFRFISISSWYSHKNLDLIPKIQEVLQCQGISNVEFVLTLEPWDFYQKLMRGRKIPGIHNVGPIPPEECPSLYQECDALFLPTLAECFSASYPEAMKMGKPIITTDLGFARSICGEAALFYEAKNAKEAARQIKRLIKDIGLQQKLITKGNEQLKTFDTSKERASKYIELCEKLAIGDQ